jgi:hypothetical protein
VFDYDFLEGANVVIWLCPFDLVWKEDLVLSA